MATTTPNYGWSVPTSSDLVKNGATDIETLGDSVDASLWNSGYGQAAKNKIINGDFSVNQRNFSSSTTSAEYNFDRWRTIYTGGTSTTSAQVFTPGTAPVAGYEGKNYYRVVITGQSATTDSVRMQQQVESVRTFAGQTTTYSFWAKASAGTPKVAVISVQGFGTGGSPSAAVQTEHGTITLSTLWARYSVTVALPSISGKTLGTAGDDSVSVRLLMSAGSAVSGNQSIGVQNYTFETWGHQWEYGSKATPFQTASGGSPQAELAMCQRYFFRAVNGADDASEHVGNGQWYNSTITQTVFRFPVIMRTAPTMSVSSAGHFAQTQGGSTARTVTSTAYYNTTPRSTHLDFTASTATATAGHSTVLAAQSSSATLDFSSEL
jgi:hypothetical protein